MIFIFLGIAIIFGVLIFYRQNTSTPPVTSEKCEVCPPPVTHPTCEVCPPPVTSEKCEVCPPSVKCEPGKQGPPGEKGDTGPRGMMGPQGLPGIKGETGFKGETGPRGLPGIKGDTGPRGMTGLQGLSGIKGETGPKGETGQQGLPGNKGETGPQGPAGIPGTPGPKGDIGQMGIKGDKGDPGIMLSNWTVNENPNKICFLQKSNQTQYCIDAQSETANFSTAPSLSYSETFKNFGQATETAFSNFISSIPLDVQFKKLTLSSSVSTTPATTTNTTIINGIINSLKNNGNPQYSASANDNSGNFWVVGRCGSGIELSYGPSSGPNSCSGVVTLRPGIGNTNWGGAGTTCGAPTQTISIQLS
jgi:hypothetical protein